MPGAQLQLDLGQLVPWLKDLGEQAARIDWKPALKQMALLLESAAKQNFDGSHAPDGTPWKPLKRPRERPRDKRARKGFNESQKPLRDTGLLMASLSANGPHHVEDITATVLNWGTNLEYAGVHQFGHTFNRPAKTRTKPWVFTTPDGRKVFTRKIRAHTQTIPARPFLGLTPELLADMDQLLWDEFQRQVGGHA